MVTMRQVASFRNQADLIHKAAVRAGYEVVAHSLQDLVGPPKERWDKLIALIPLWPRYIFECNRLAAPWMSRSHVIYGPVDGPFQMNINLFDIMKNLRIVTPSCWCKQMMERNGLSVFGVVYHGIDHADFDFSDQARYTRMAYLRKQYPNHVILFSNLNPIHRKGFIHLRKALDILAKSVKEKWVFILHTNLKAALAIDPKLQEAPNLIVEDTYNTLPFKAIAEKTAACDIFVFPSLLEGFGLPILEAAAAGRTIVCLDSAPMNEIVATKEAWLFPYRTIKEERWGNGSLAQLHEYDPKDLAYAIESAITEKEESRAKAEAAYKRSYAFDFMKVYTPLVKM